MEELRQAEPTPVAATSNAACLPNGKGRSRCRKGLFLLIQMVSGEDRKKNLSLGINLAEGGQDLSQGYHTETHALGNS